MLNLWICWVWLMIFVRLKSPASRLFAQPFVQALIKVNIKVPRHWPVWGEFKWPVNSPHIGPVKRNMFPFDDVIMVKEGLVWILLSWALYQLAVTTEMDTTDNVVQHTKAETNSLPFCRRQFQNHFRWGNCVILISISLKFVPNDPINRQSVFL